MIYGRDQRSENVNCERPVLQRSQLTITVPDPLVHSYSLGCIRVLRTCELCTDMINARDK